MADPLGTPKRGSVSPFLNNFSTVNSTIEEVRRMRQFRHQTPVAGAGQNTLDDLPPGIRVWIRNDTGVDLNPFDTVKLGIPTVDLDTDSLAFRAQPIFPGTVPDATDNDFAILTEPAAAYSQGVYGFARAVVQGVVPVDVNITDSTHNFATPTAGDRTQLTSASSGPVKIIYKPSGTGKKRCVAQLLLQGSAAATSWVAGELATSSNISPASATPTALTFNFAGLDTGGFYSAGSPTRLTFPESGVYLIGCSVIFVGPFPYDAEVQLMYNGSAQIVGDSRTLPSSAIAHQGLTISTIQAVATPGDYITALATQYSGGIRSIGYDGTMESRIWAYKIH